jgi:hypothetical protein
MRNSPVLDFDVDGISVSWPAKWRWQTPQVRRLGWADIDKVVAYKRDCYLVDQICLEFLTVAGDSVMITEETNDWKELACALPKFLPGFPVFEAWFSNIAFPPFEGNLAILYDRSAP